MKTNYTIALLFGVLGLLLVAAAKFGGGTPVDQTFTYQGQLRNAGQLVNGPVDLRITLWDADVAGGQVGSANTFNAMQLNDGRFACGLNFGGAAFDGSNRWIQVEFRNPAGSGQYQALTPRDKITATPYALYALNGANGVWVYDTDQQSLTAPGKRVVIMGPSNPTTALEVVSTTGGDDSVKLPAGSVGAAELAVGLPASNSMQFGFSGNPGQYSPAEQSLTFVAPSNGWVTIILNRSSYFEGTSLKWNGQDLPSAPNFNIWRYFVTAGSTNALVARHVGYISSGTGGHFVVLFVERSLN